MASDDSAPSEFSGYPGMYQPEPHPLTAIEQARLERAVDPADPNDSVEKARERGNGRSA